MEPYYFDYFDFTEPSYISTKKIKPYKRPIKSTKPVIKEVQAHQKIHRKQGR